MTAKTRLLLVNSAVAFAIALLLMITVHEFAHALAGLALGLRPMVFPNQVTYGVAGTTGQQLVTAVMGPLVSLVVGVALLAAVRTVRGFWGLLLFWFATLSVQECTGYLMTGPFFAAGDIGQALHLLSAPVWAGALVLVVGALGTVALGRIATRRLMAMTSAGVPDLSTQL